MKVGDLIMFSKRHQKKPGLDYTQDWIGILVEKIVDSVGVTEELHIWWMHGKISDYPSSWWDNLSYEPFEVISESR